MIKPSEYKRRRKKLMQLMGKGSIAILPAARRCTRNQDVHYPYRQHSDFYYLTGFTEPDAVAVLIPGRKAGQYILFCQEKDPEKEQWEGQITGQEGAIDRYGADDSFPIADLDDILPNMLEQCERVYYAMGCDPELDQRMSQWIAQIRSKSRSGIQAPQEFIAIDHYLHEMRLHKSRSEVALMRKAAKISARAHKRLMRACYEGRWEYQLAADFKHECALQGAVEQAYPPIVGSGERATILHYIDNQAPLQSGDLVLVDAGCEYQYYAADITRTYPVSGRFNAAQKKLYQLVLNAQLAAIAAVQPGAAYDEPHQAAVKVLTQGLVALGLLAGNWQQLIKEEAYKKYYMHGTGHWLGLDVHDVGDYKIDGEWRPLEPGMVLTIEPGLYIRADDQSVAPEWRGIGIRIEDDVLVTKDGHEVLTKDVPKTIAEIEQWMAKK